MNSIHELGRRLQNCPAGASGWREFEDACVAVLTYLFVPPLSLPHIQPRSYSGIDRRDVVFPNRNFETNNNWGLLYKELHARMVLFEFKNYDSTEIGKEETLQTLNYMTDTMGKLAIMCCNRVPDEAAHIKRNSAFSASGRVVLFITTEQLIEMLFIKERGEDPSDLIIDLLERFYLQHE
jgi:hypothetical protein